MFEGWGRTVYRRRWLVLAIAAIGMVLFAVWGTGVFGALQSAGGGRVTELTARPLINLFYPMLSGLVQPLSGGSAS